MSETASGRPVMPLENGVDFFRWFDQLRPQTYNVIGGEGTLSKADRAFLHMRRGLALLLREVSSRYTPAEALTFAFAVSNPSLLRDPQRGAAYLRGLASKPLAGLLSVPLECAAHVFEECEAAKDSTLNRAAA